jgi:hypothetical protein
VLRAGADPGFQVGGVALKKIAPSGGKREKFWGISCEKSRFYAKKIQFAYLLEIKSDSMNVTHTLFIHCIAFHKPSQLKKT